MHERAFELEAFAKQAAADGFETAVLLGMGGSSLAPEVFMTDVRRRRRRARAHRARHHAPVTIERVTSELELPTTLFIVASKSGGTTETLSHFAHFWDATPNGNQFVAITDPGTSLETLAREHGFRALFLNPDDIGGRYSALSYFGLVPAALIGAPLHEVLDSAEEMQTASERIVPAAQSPGATLGALMGEAARAGRDKITLALPEEIASFGSWVEQLIAESTGKEGVGIVPVGELLGPPDVYGQDRLFVAIGEHEASDRSRPSGTRSRGSRSTPASRSGASSSAGRWRRRSPATSWGSTRSTSPTCRRPRTRRRRSASGRSRTPGSTSSTPARGGGRGRLRGDPRVPGPDLGDRGRDRARSPRDPRRSKVATTTGFGPRFLHSTGQLHKGGRTAASSSRSWTGIGRRPADPRPAVHVRNADRRAGARRPALAPDGRRVARVTLDDLTEVG